MDLSCRSIRTKLGTAAAPLSFLAEQEWGQSPIHQNVTVTDPEGQTPCRAVFPRVPLRDLILVNCENLSSKARAQNRINFKTGDFVLVDPQRFEVHKVVELDDRTHDDVRWKDRDAFIDDVLGRAGLPIIHCKCKLFYDPASLRSQLNLPPVLLET